MSITEPPTDTTGTLRIQQTPRWFTGRSELIVVAGVLALAAAMTVGIVAMEVPEGTAFPGPQFFPIIVTVFLYGVGLALAVSVLVSPRRAHVSDDPTEVSTDMLEDLGSIDDTSEIRIVAPEGQVARQPESAATPIDWKTVGITVGALAAFIVVLPFVGWLLSAAGLFWVLSWAFGSRRPLLDIGTAIIISSFIQLAFGQGLGLSLPAGILEGAFPWIS
ncbi:tripartite tricarboxylate transporter TctB family protein [Microbacterium sp. 18062]|uniref:tripartite tricarboxylate transporter TctB family protein n=1 Tax=Microbacterium sp. 18062 TaxID=2681410 RepID=UPI00190F9159|nr:tripartite tricarboxylate transporter TctB family protein [Microbacterium sp. 18062]